MPLYEYHCPACGASFEQIVRFSQADLTPACPECGYPDTRKAITAAASFSTSSGSASSSTCAPGGRFT